MKTLHPPLNWLNFRSWHSMCLRVYNSHILYSSIRYQFGKFRNKEWSNWTLMQLYTRQQTRQVGSGSTRFLWQGFGSMELYKGISEFPSSSSREALAIRTAIESCWRRWKEIIVESDAKLVIDKIQNRETLDPHLVTVIEDILSLVSIFTKCFLIFAKGMQHYRTQNNKVCYSLVWKCEVEIFSSGWKKLLKTMWTIVQ